MSLTLAAALFFQAHANANLKNFHTKQIITEDPKSSRLKSKQERQGTAVRGTLKQWIQKNESFCGNPLLTGWNLGPEEKKTLPPRRGCMVLPPAKSHIKVSFYLFYKAVTWLHQRQTKSKNFSLPSSGQTIKKSTFFYEFVSFFLCNTGKLRQHNYRPKCPHCHLPTLFLCLNEPPSLCPPQVLSTPLGYSSLDVHWMFTCVYVHTC